MAHDWIRNNILGLVAIFIALSGTAVATTVASQDNTAQSAKKKKAKRGPRGFTGARGPTGLRGPVGPSTGVAGGDLIGNFPNPLIGPDAITGAEIADGQVDRFDIAGSAIEAQHVTNANFSTGLRQSDIAVVLPNRAFDPTQQADFECQTIFTDPVNGVPVGSFIIAINTTNTSGAGWSTNPVTTADTITMQYCNLTGTFGFDPSPQTFKMLAILP